MSQEHSLIQRINKTIQIGRACRLVWEGGPGFVVGNIALLLVQGILPLASMYLVKLIIDAVSHGVSVQDRIAVFQRVLFLVALSGVIALIAALCRSISQMLNEIQSRAVADHVQDVIHSKSLEMDLEYYENSSYYDTLHRAQAEAAIRPSRIVSGLSQIAQSAISLAAMAGLLFSLNWKLGMVLFITAIPSGIIRRLYSARLYNWQHQVTERERKAWYFSWMISRDTHAKEIRLFDLGELFRKRYQELRYGIRKESVDIITKRTKADFIARIAGIGGIFGSFAYIAYKAIYGSITAGSLVMYFQAFQRGVDSLEQALGSLVALYEDNLFVSNLYEFLDLKPKILESKEPLHFPKPVRDGIVFDNVTFRYPESDKYALKNVTCAIRPGEMVAFVGENGSGKTTLIKLLCRLYDMGHGSIEIDGIDLRRFRTTDLRSQISVIFQDYARYNLSARENIWLGDVSKPPCEYAIVSAARQSGAEDIITDLAHEYDTVLGNWFDDGAELSIGQWQRVALARAFFRDAPIIILDEPTSAIDAKAEYEFFDRFRQLVEGHITILISHRFSTVRMADRIFVLEKGELIESGTHEELMRLNGKYAGMFSMQAENYVL